MKMGRSVCYFVIAGFAIAWMGTGAIAQDKPASTSETPAGTASTQTTTASISRWLAY